MQECNPNLEFELPAYDTDAWRETVGPCLDEKELDSLCEQLEDGFDFGLDPDNLPERIVDCKNPPSTEEIDVGLSKTIYKWWTRKQILGPFSRQQALSFGVRVNPMFGVPKPTGAIRPVINHSWPKR